MSAPFVCRMTSLLITGLLLLGSPGQLSSATAGVIPLEYRRSAAGIDLAGMVGLCPTGYYGAVGGDGTNAGNGLSTNTESR